MGDLEARDIAAATPHFFKGVSDAVAKKCVEYWWLDKNGRIFYNQTGRGIEWRIRTARGSPIGYSGVEGVNFTSRNDFSVAALSYKGIADGIMLTWQEVEQCRGEEAIFDLTKALMDNLEADLLDRLSTDFYGDGSALNSKTIQGLAASINKDVNLTYAGISQSTTTAWANQAVSGAGFSADPHAKCLELQIACAKGEKGGRTRNQIDIYLADGTQYQRVANKAVANQRFLRDEEMAKIGFKNYLVHDVPFVWSEYATASTVFGLNSKLFGLYCTTSEAFKSISDWTVGFPRVFIIGGMSCMNLVNMNPRGSGLIYTIT